MVIRRVDSQPQKSFSIFVDDLPGLADREWLRSLFVQFGEVTDIYISTKARRSKSSPFAFVRFKLEDDASRAIVEMDGKQFEGYKLSLSVAKAWPRKEAVSNLAGGSHKQSLWNLDAG